MEVNVSQPWLGHILKGRKTIEGRLNKGKFADLRVGSIVIFSGPLSSRTSATRTPANSSSNRKVAVITRIDKYSTFQEYLSQSGLDRTLPGVATIDDGVAIYRQFYTPDMEKQYGILAIHFLLAK